MTARQMQESGMLNAHVRMNGSALQQVYFRVLNVDNGQRQPWAAITLSINPKLAGATRTLFGPQQALRCKSKSCFIAQAKDEEQSATEQPHSMSLRQEKLVHGKRRRIARSWDACRRKSLYNG